VTLTPNSGAKPRNNNNNNNNNDDNNNNDADDNSDEDSNDDNIPLDYVVRYNDRVCGGDVLTNYGVGEQRRIAGVCQRT
jgi:hypothetical protein